MRSSDNAKNYVGGVQNAVLVNQYTYTHIATLTAYMYNIIYVICMYIKSDIRTILIMLKYSSKKNSESESLFGFVISVKINY